MEVFLLLWKFPKINTLFQFSLVVGFPAGSHGKESACNAENLGLIPGLGRSPQGGCGNLLQYSCLENPYWQRSLAGYSPWGHKELDTNEWLGAALLVKSSEEVKILGMLSATESRAVVLEKTLESPLDCKEIHPVHPEGDQSWVFNGRTDAEAETPILWLPRKELTHLKRPWC